MKRRQNTFAGMDIKRCILLPLCLLLVLLPCSACRAEDSAQSLVQRLEKEMYDKNKVSDEVAGTSGNVEFTLLSLHYGSFSHESAQEVVALFDYVEPFAPSGCRGLWLTLYDASTMEILAETWYGVRAGGLGAYFLPDSGGRTRVLVLAGGSSQGYNWTNAALLDAENGAWTEVPLAAEDVLDPKGSYFYQVTEHMNEKMLLLVLENTEGAQWPYHLWEEYERSFSNVAAALVWSPESGMFVPLTEESLY